MLTPISNRRKFTAKKNKTWDGDGVLSVGNGYAHLQDVSGKDMGKTAWNAPLLPGSTLSVGGKDVEVDCLITKEDFLAGKPFLGGIHKTLIPKLEEPLRLSLKVQAKQEKLVARQVNKANVSAPSSKIGRAHV